MKAEILSGQYIEDSDRNPLLINDTWVPVDEIPIFVDNQEDMGILESIACSSKWSNRTCWPQRICKPIGRFQPETNILPEINASDIDQTDIQTDVNLSFSHVWEYANMDEHHTPKKK